MPTIHHGDCIQVMNAMPANSIDAIVTDPPYGLGFMGRKWDSLPPSLEWAEACMRVLKPGGHIVAFGGTRTWHRLAVAIEDAGFEMRDSLAWLYGSGFPKSHDVGKSTGDERYAGHGTALKPAFEPIVLARKPFPGTVAKNVLEHSTGAINIDACRIGYASETDKASAAPQGRATARPGNLAGKAQAWESSTTATEKSTTASMTDTPASLSPTSVSTAGGMARGEFTPNRSDAGRWPANVVLDQHTAAWVDEQSGTVHWQATNNSRKGSSWGVGDATQTRKAYDAPKHIKEPNTGGGASRFFYVAKAPKRERPNVNGVQHPTVKPLALMRWLLRLVTPPGGTVLDPFAGSGTTIEAAMQEGFNPVGIEMTDEYLPLIQHRIDRQEA